MDDNEEQEEASATSQNRKNSEDEEYDKVLKNINETLRQNRRHSLHGKDGRKISKEESKALMNSTRTDSVTENTNIHANPMKKSPSHPAIELRY